MEIGDRRLEIGDFGVSFLSGDPLKAGHPLLVILSFAPNLVSVAQRFGAKLRMTKKKRLESGNAKKWPEKAHAVARSGNRRYGSCLKMRFKLIFTKGVSHNTLFRR